MILKTNFLPSVNITVVIRKTIKWNYLISVQILGRRKLHFRSAHLCEFVDELRLISSYVFSLSHYGVISRKSSVLIIGGRCDGISSALVAKYAIDEWERVGNLQNSREYHRAIVNDNRFYVVGGAGTL